MGKIGAAIGAIVGYGAGQWVAPMLGQTGPIAMVLGLVGAVIFLGVGSKVIPL